MEGQELPEGEFEYVFDYLDPEDEWTLSDNLLLWYILVFINSYLQVSLSDAPTENVFITSCLKESVQYKYNYNVACEDQPNPNVNVS